MYGNKLLSITYCPHLTFPDSETENKIFNEQNSK